MKLGFIWSRPSEQLRQQESGGFFLFRWMFPWAISVSMLLVVYLIIGIGTAVPERGMPRPFIATAPLLSHPEPFGHGPARTDGYGKSGDLKGP